jgi:hypothetical protein
MLSIIQFRIFYLPVSYQTLNIKIHKIIILPGVLYMCGHGSHGEYQDQRGRQ